MENTNKRKTDSLRVLIAALLCLIVPYMASAQQAVTVQGRVTDAENQPLIGVSVLVKGTTTGVSTVTTRSRPRPTEPSNSHSSA